MPMIIAATALALLWPPLAVLPWLLRKPSRRWRAQRVHRRQAMIVARLIPDVAELLVVAVHAGLTPQLAIRAVADAVEPPFRTAFTSVVSRTDAGQRFADALAHLVGDLGPPARLLVSALTATERYGVALTASMEAAAADLRAERRRAAEAAARRLPVQMAFPLVGCILPAFALLTLAPLLAGALSGLHL
jgi:tight adherence protein C